MWYFSNNRHECTPLYLIFNVLHYYLLSTLGNIAHMFYKHS